MISFLNFIVVLSVAEVLTIMMEGIGVGSTKVATDASASVCCAK